MKYTMSFEVVSILAFHCRIYDHQNSSILNKELPLAFARGFVLHTKGKKINWV